MRCERGALNRQLALLLGWTTIESAGTALLGTPPWWAGNSRGQAAIPDWEADWSACGPLMVKYGCYPFAVTVRGGGVVNVACELGRWEKWPGRAPGAVLIRIDDYASEDGAVRAAVIQAVIERLAAEQG